MKSVILMLLLFLLISTVSFAQIDRSRRYNAFSGSMVFTVDGGATIGQTDYRTIKPDYLGRLSLEYFLPATTRSSFGIRGFVGQGYISGKDNMLNPDVFRTKLAFAGGGFVYSLSFNDELFPYLLAGASYLWFDPYGENGQRLPNNQNEVYKKSEINYTGELGLRVMITENLSFNFSGGIQFGPSDYLDDKALGTNNDYFYYTSAGFSFSFFGGNDEDKDGVPDSRDECPGTPQGVRVDKNGCPLDADNDGIPDYRDKCPNTPKGVKVDSNGCPLDSDGDGVPDYKDICPNTPHGVKVDDLGCPLDSDGDGVPDFKDKCPHTPYNVQVDDNGCPLDSDHDGVPDYLDDCPNTAPGVKVDSNGCPVNIHKTENEIRNYTLSASAGFASGKSDLLPSAYTSLESLINFMKENPGSKWLIEGYTDNVGSASINKKLSRERAESVLRYFISHGLSGSRFEILGKGEADPVANNATAAGRALNRRVEIKRIK